MLANHSPWSPTMASRQMIPMTCPCNLISSNSGMQTPLREVAIPHLTQHCTCRLNHGAGALAYVSMRISPREPRTHKRMSYTTCDRLRLLVLAGARLLLRGLAACGR